MYLLHPSTLPPSPLLSLSNHRLWCYQHACLSFPSHPSRTVTNQLRLSFSHRTYSLSMNPAIFVAPILLYSSYIYCLIMSLSPNCASYVEHILGLILPLKLMSHRSQLRLFFFFAIIIIYIRCELLGIFVVMCYKFLELVSCVRILLQPM